MFSTLGWAELGWICTMHSGWFGGSEFNLNNIRNIFKFKLNNNIKILF